VIFHSYVSLPEGNLNCTPNTRSWPVRRLAVLATLATRVAFGDQLLNLLATVRTQHVVLLEAKQRRNSRLYGFFLANTELTGIQSQ
jgi:hypothetical protein